MLWSRSGIGLEICRPLAQRGFYVLLGSRDEAHGRKAAAELAEKGAEVEAVIVDVGRPATFEIVRKLIADRFGRLDVLITPELATKRIGKARRRTCRSTHCGAPLKRTFLAWLIMTQRLLPLLRRSNNSRIVNQSSILGSLTEHSDPSKTAVNAFTVHLAKVLRCSSIKVNSAHPGSVKTDMNPTGDLNVEEGAETAVELATLGDDGPTGGFFYRGTRLPW